MVKYEPQQLFLFWLSFLLFLVAEPPKVPLEILTEDQVKEALEKFKALDIYKEVLQLDRIDKPPPQVQKLIEQSGQKILSDATTQIGTVYLNSSLKCNL